MRRLAWLILLCAVVAIACGAPRQPLDGGKDYAAADRWIEEKLQQAREGSVDPVFVNALMTLSQFNLDHGNYATAVHTIEPLAELLEIVHGQDATETAAVLEVLAKVYCEIDRCDEGTPLLDRAARIRAAPPGPEGN